MLRLFWLTHKHHFFILSWARGGISIFQKYILVREKRPHALSRHRRLFYALNNWIPIERILQESVPGGISSPSYKRSIQVKKCSHLLVEYWTHIPRGKPKWNAIILMKQACNAPASSVGQSSQCRAKESSEALPQTDPPSVAGYCGGRASGEKSYSINWDKAMLVSSNVIRLRCWFCMTLTVNRFELRNRNRSTIPIILCTLLVLQKPWPRPGIQGFNSIAPVPLLLKG